MSAGPPQPGEVPSRWPPRSLRLAQKALVSSGPRQDASRQEARAANQGAAFSWQGLFRREMKRWRQHPGEERAGRHKKQEAGRIFLRGWASSLVSSPLTPWEDAGGAWELPFPWRAFGFVCICVCLHVCMYTMCERCPQKPEEGVSFPAMGVTNNCGLPRGC